VFLSDSRTNAGLDQISTFRKMIVYEKPGDRFMCLLSAGNLSISQSVREILQVEQLKDHEGGEPITIWNAKSMFDAARVLGSAVRHVYQRDGEALKRAGVEFNVSMIFGGQIPARACACSRSIRRATSSRPRPKRRSSRSAKASTASRCSTA
jgi:putative proteasome-type protease